MFTTVTDPAEQRPAELLSRQFRAPAPNRLWVADITFVRTWQGFCYTAFVTDACARKVVGWAVAASMRTEDLPLQAFEHAVWQANSDVSGLVHHSDRGSQYYRWYVPSGWPSLGSPPRWARGNSYDNALAEAVNAAYRTELINRGKPWQTVALHRRRRASHRPMGVLVQRGTPARDPRLRSTSRVRGRPHRRLTPSEPAYPGPRNRVGAKPEYFNQGRTTKPQPAGRWPPA